MILKYFVCPLLACLACGQAVPASDLHSNTASQTSTRSSTKDNAATQVAPGDVVITINDFCPGQPQSSHTCKTMITRAQFEKLTEALEPGMPLPLRLKVANAYARNLRMSAEAEKRGLDNTPGFEEEIRYARMQLLSQDLNRELQQEATTIADADIATYYLQHEADYEEATFARIFVPHTRQGAPAHDQMDAVKESGKETQSDVDAMTKLAEDLRARAAKGEDPDKLQIAAYREAGIERTSVNTLIESARPNTLPPQHALAMDLKPGEVSQVFSDPEGAHFIYKMLKQEILSLNAVKTEIRKTITNQRYRDSMKGFEGNVVFSDAYFNPPKKMDSAGQHRERGAKPPGQSE